MKALESQPVFKQQPYLLAGELQSQLKLTGTV
jgi:hypothetical protein